MKSKNSGVSVHGGQLTRKERNRARQEGRRAARAIWAALDGRRPPGDPRVTSGPSTYAACYVEELQAQVNCSCNLLIAELLAANVSVIEAIYRQADVVVREKDLTGAVAPRARERFDQRYRPWQVAVAESHRRARAESARADQFVAAYWAEVVSAAPSDRDGRLRSLWPQPHVELDPIWEKTDHLLLVQPREEAEDSASVLATRNLRRALRILADPATPAQRCES
jgi:hypothetical protein